MFVRRPREEVELNVASMLDMAFQLLTFFILTFRPPPTEEAVLMHMPPAQHTEVGHNEPGSHTEVTPVEIKGLRSLVVTVTARAGKIDSMTIGDQKIAGLPELHRRLTELTGPDSLFEQVVLRTDGQLHYGELMQIIGACPRKKQADDREWGKLSIVEMNAAGT
jgi:biopolymer transport protein ExbD